jgi:tRNA 2-thiouridine synthesizing protein A
MTDVDLEIDTLGLKCPLPVLRVKKRIQDLSVNAVIRVIADDPTTLRDVAAWCELSGHRLLDSTECTDPARFVYHIVLSGMTKDGS